MLVLSIGMIAQEPEKVHRVKILELENDRRLKAVEVLELDHYSFDEKGQIICIITDSELKRLKGAGLKYEVLMADVNKRLNEINAKILEDEKNGIKPNEQEAARGAFEQRGKRVDQIIQTPSAFVLPTTFGGYWSYAQMVTLMGNLKNSYPDIVDTFGIGFTYQNRRILVVKISDNVTVDENEPEVLFMGLQHAREAISGSSMIMLMQYLAERYYANDPKVVNLVQNREIFIIACFNADGWEYNRTNNGGNPGGSWRKNRRPQTGGTGVDLNRNWGTDWSLCPNPPGSCGSNSASSDVYYGTSAFSEPETRAVRDWVYTRHFSAMIDQHAYGPYYSLPFGRPSLHSMSTEDANFYTRIPALMGTYNGMRAGNSPQSVNYEVAGGVKDWMLMGNIGTGTKGKIYGMTGEGGAAGGSSSGNEFWPRRDSITRLCKGMVYQDIQLALAAGSYVDIQDQGNLSVNNRFGNFDFTIRRIGVGNAAITVSLIPLENVGLAGAPLSYPAGITTYYGTISGSISYALPWTIQNGNGQRLRYIWRVQTGGITYDDTVTKYYNPVEMIYDDMEGGTYGSFAANWTSSASLNPDGVGGTMWNYSTLGSGAYQGTGSLQESPGTVYDWNDSLFVTRNGSLNLANATQATLSFWTRHRAENSRDRLQLVISIDNGATWQNTLPVPGSHTVSEYNDGDGSTLRGRPALTGIRDIWTRVTYDLTPYTGPGRTQVRFRFIFMSDGDNTPYAFRQDDGFYIDNLQVIKSTVPMSILPVRFVYVRGKLLQNRNIEVSWEAETDGQHDYFEIERSDDGSNFHAIGKVTTISATYKFFDKAPHVGNNFYRIKQYDKNGNFTYSEVVNVKNVYGGGVQMYPNPLTETNLLTIRTESNFTSPVNVRITDAQGRVVFQQFVNEWPTSKQIRINTASWTPQIYVLKITNNRGEFITVEKIVKH